MGPVLVCNDLVVVYLSTEEGEVYYGDQMTRKEGEKRDK